jgi:hypothetical protein
MCFLLVILRNHLRLSFWLYYLTTVNTGSYNTISITGVHVQEHIGCTKLCTRNICLCGQHLLLAFGTVGMFVPLEKYSYSMIYFQPIGFVGVFFPQ